MRDSRFADAIMATVLLAVSHQVAHAQDTQPPASADTVHVAPPTGEREADRASILAALERAVPGSVVQFAAGTYRIGEFITVSTPRVTLLGHPAGTTLRGCDPAAFGDVARAVVACNGLELTGTRQTVRGLTFEHMWQAVWVGCCMPDELQSMPDGRADRPHLGGHLIQGNTFRSTVNGFRVIGDSPEPVTVRDNDFVNVWHAGAVNGRTAHILDNRIRVPDAGAVPPNGFPGLALVITGNDTRLEQAFTCAGNLIAGNHIEGHPEGVAIMALGGKGICRDNVIRDNTIRVARVRFSGTPWGVTGIADQTDSTLAGVPISLVDLSEETSAIFGLPAVTRTEILIRDNVVESNRILGAEGLGMEILRASGNRIVDNTISGITRREPFPGNTMYIPPPWGAANGSGIWVSAGSEGNEIAGNTFDDIAAFAVVIEGDSNDIGASTQEAGPADRPVALVRTRSLTWEGEQTYIALYADGTASGLIVVNFAGGQLYGTSTPDSWSWLDASTVEICAGDITVLRNEIGFTPPERECAPHSITGRNLDMDGDGNVDLIETFDILDESFYRARPGGGAA